MKCDMWATPYLQGLIIFVAALTFEVKKTI